MSISRLVPRPTSITSILSALPVGGNKIGTVGLIDTGVVSTLNSTATNLAISGVFTGTGEDVSQYAEIRIFIANNQASATNGLSVQFSTDNVTYYATDPYTVAIGTTNPFQISVPVGARYFRLSYTNGAVATTITNIQVIYNVVAGNPSSSRLADALTNENDTMDVGARLLGFDGTNWWRLRTAAGTGILQTVLTAGTAAIGSVTITSGTITTVSAVTALLGQGAAGATAAGNPLRTALLAKTANPTAVTDGQAVNAMGDKLGRAITQPSLRQLRGANTVTLTTTGETTLIAAVASTFNDITGITFSNSSASAVTISLRSTTGGTVIKSWTLPAGSVGGPPITTPWPQAAVNTNWTVQLSGAVTSVIVNVEYVAEI